ncbi:MULTISPECIES: cupin domain-containing protein [Cytobacillus]|uniref:Cupin n=2 Tax=Cytobacillus oceanisediminis TaxID=665099 RepID=A0A161J5K0_9BACI|nr:MULTISPECIES: cupin domain-containing protein [Cytobacillus]MCS0825781.1 cupin domain-containing protein [Cytobacillus firmus]AND40361.1 cupin [Cytobacillus oceanisediminis 2691]MCM3404455.1 cupin domain-containing protein [Cytobacillus oceanisediminis]MCM3530630.1 cupin domain-containing protein [Cytobacillus oceanisediminis]MDK7668543.1 cupin domain-containing protein [Cytobacillus oceanisediminis]
MYHPNAYSYPYYPLVNAPVFHTDNMLRSNQDHFQQLCETVLEGVKREASVLELYTQLAEQAPNEEHKQNIIQAIEGKKVHLTHFCNLYYNLTGTQPEYQIGEVSIDHYRDGLQRAYQLEMEGFQENQRGSALSQLPQVQNVFIWAMTGEQENAARLVTLNDRITDYGPQPFVVDIEEATKQNNTFRTAIWTGEHLQLTLMSINAGEDIGLEIHPELDQFLRIEEGEGIVQMGDSKDQLDFQRKVADDFAIIIPAGKYHNVINTGSKPLKLYSIYSPPQHPFGTVHQTKADAMAAEEEHQQGN